MTREEKTKYQDKKAVAVCCDGLVGIECLDIIYGIDDYMVVRGYNNDLHKVKVYERINTENPEGYHYIKLYGRRYNTSDFMRV